MLVIKKPKMQHLRTNWYFPLLVLATFVWAGQGCGIAQYSWGILPAFIFAILIASSIPSIHNDMKNLHV